MKAPTGKLAFAYRTISELEAERDQLRAEVEALRVLLRESYSEFLAIKSEIGFRGNTIALIGRIDAAMVAKEGK